MGQRIALVTGGTRGIGAGIARRLHALGYRVAVNYARDAATAARFAKETGLPVYKFDVGDAAACADSIGRIEADLGPIDTLVNNAGITRDGVFHKMTFERWQAVIRTNLDSQYACTRPLIDGMRARGFGRIVLIASLSGQIGLPGQTNYAASKAGMIGFAKALAQENAGRGITVNVVAPGYVATDMVSALPDPILAGLAAGIPVGRIGQVEEIAGAVAFLAAETSGFITGATLSINGGQTMI